MPKIPTSLGSPVIPQAGRASRVAYLDTTGLGQDLIKGSRIEGTVGHATAAGMQQVGQAFDYLQGEQDKKEAKDWLNQLIQQKTDLMYGDGTDKNPGYMNMQGDAAVKAAKTTSAQLDKMRQDLLGKASNKQVANLFDAASVQLIQPDHEDILKHASKEHLVALDATDDATVAAATDQLAANPTSDQVARQSTTLIAGSILAKLDRQGITDPVVRNQAVLEAVSASKAAAIQAALVRDPKSGAALYAKWKDQIQGTDQAKLEQSITAAEDRQMRKEEHAAYMSEHYQKIASDQALTDYAKQIINHAADPTKYPDVSLETIGNDKRLQGPDAITLYNMQRQADKGESDPARSRKTLAQLLPEIMRPYGDPRKLTTYKEINELMAGGLLTKSDWSFAAGLIDQGRTEDGAKIQPQMGAALSAATRVIGKPDINGIFPDDRHAIMLQQWTQHMYDMVDKYQRDNKNPYDLFNPDKPDYLLSPGELQKYQIPFDNTVQHTIQQMQGGGGGDLPLPTAPSEETIPTISNPNDPAYTNLPPGAPYYRLDANGNRKRYTKGNAPAAAPAVTAPTGQ